MIQSPKLSETTATIMSMTTRAGLTPTPITDKNGVTAVRWTKPANETKASSVIPNVTATPIPNRRTFAGAMRELSGLGIDLSHYPRSATNGLRVLNKDHPQIFATVIDDINTADPATLAIWKNFFRESMPADAYTHRSSYERMVVNAELTARLLEAIGTGIIKTPRLFQIDTIATTLEASLGVRPGDERYNEVQAGIIHCTLTHPDRITRITSDEWYRNADREDLKYIAENLDRIIPLLPELCKRRDPTRHSIETVLAAPAALAEGAL